mmetsp:Transcript_3735/g.5775  ORF Transcript_3735/g.5775 Transcript_3735/m.5775 type:complete len:271 (-) Transcript_3735:30-842(-)|eukprot:CAMPEP_0169244776 /NCGR_PEP_ID=MMETSP1016-20121227/33830_1 /TAXON_ID=342587 /ORGANISM="Karlodinium micrum, Strain CCMP2283" /LENGTH=270 /DNA_ID=CAMNT_0009325209 /DNA_START=67 /DNA_END=879 /DNA_ORIENTATION=+
MRAKLLVFITTAPSLAVCVISPDKGVIRREGRSERQVQLDQEGHMQLLQNDEFPAPGKLQKELLNLGISKKAADDYPCDIQYIQMPAEGTDECSGSPMTYEIKDALDCEKAAESLGLTKGSPVEINNYHATSPPGVLNIVHKCYLNTTSQTVHFNPTEPTSTEALQGKKICWRTKYHEVKPDAGQRGDLCMSLTQADPITTYGECWAAASCVSGMPCEHVPFNVSDTSKPAGCWRNNIGCWSYNDKTIDEVDFNSDVNLTQVCKNQDSVS